MLRFVTFFSFLIALGHASLFCPHTKLPSDVKSFQTMRIQVKKSVGQEPMFRISSTDDTDKSFSSSSSRFRLLTRTDNVECPSKGCITELSGAQPKHQSSILYLTNIIGKMIPPGFQHIDSATRLYCVIMAGDCGATVPIYRYYKFLPSGLYHAYSTNEDVEIEGFTREPSPLCYGWQTLSTEQLRAEGREGSGEDYSSEEETDEENIQVTSEERDEAKQEVFQMVSEVCDNKIPPKPSSMKSLNIYVNDKIGALKDHYYTTKVATEEDEKDKESEFYGYHLDKIESIGMVVVDEEKSKCGCLIRLSQMLDNQKEAMIPRKDHKLAVDFKEPPPSGGEKYTTLEEEVYCVREEGACGANVALRKYFHILELDTIYTINKTDIPPLTIPTPSGVLCYIWPNEKSAKKDPKKEEISKKHKTTTTEEPTTFAPKTTITDTKNPKTTTTPTSTTTSFTTPKSSSYTVSINNAKAHDAPAKTSEKPSTTTKTPITSKTTKTLKNDKSMAVAVKVEEKPTTTPASETTITASSTEKVKITTARFSTLEIPTVSSTKATTKSTTMKLKSKKTTKSDIKKKEENENSTKKIEEAENRNETVVDGVVFKFTN